MALSLSQRSVLRLRVDTSEGLSEGQIRRLGAQLLGHFCEFAVGGRRVVDVGRVPASDLCGRGMCALPTVSGG
jgi:hypothetical protein